MAIPDGGSGAGPGAGPPSTLAILGFLPFAVMAMVVAVDLLAGPGVGFLPLLCLGPALAAVSRRPAPTAIIGAIALLLCALLALYDNLLGTKRLAIALATIAGVGAACVVASAARHRRERELADVRAVAEVAQRVLLRPVPDEVGPVGLAVRYVSAAAAARIGGDLYEVITVGGNIRLAVGDVQGKGLPAVQTAAAVLGAFRAAAYETEDLVEIAEQIEVALARQATEHEFVTAVLAQICDGGSRIDIVSCGHPPPLLLSGGCARFIEPQEAGLPLGLSGLAAPAWKVTTVPFAPGEQMLFYTDGITEARDGSGAFYPLSRCAELLSGREPGAALDCLREDVLRHVGHPLRDDAAMLLVRRAPSEPAAP